MAYVDRFNFSFEVYKRTFVETAAVRPMVTKGLTHPRATWQAATSSQSFAERLPFREITNYGVVNPRTSDTK